MVFNLILHHAARMTAGKISVPRLISGYLRQIFSLISSLILMYEIE